MGFILWAPLGKNSPRDVHTSANLDVQLWQELVMLRHPDKSSKIAAPKATGPWIDQAKTYFLDARNSHWKSAGLLYYYSFLNLAKAFLVAKRVFTYKALESTPIFHGLANNQRVINSLLDFEIMIYPPIKNKKHNIFSHLFEKVTDTKWLFKDVITVSLKEIFCHSRHISTELDTIFRIKNSIFSTQSLMRKKNDDHWFELIVPNEHIDSVKSTIEIDLTEVQHNNFDEIDKSDWIVSYNRTATTFIGHTCVRTDPIKNVGNNNEKLNEYHKYITEKFNKHAFPTLSDTPAIPQWEFVPKLIINNKELYWHPLLSDYLFSFVISTILRYQPQLVSKDNKNSFITEAWCNQSSVASLQYFLMLFTNPPTRVNQQ